MIAVETVEESHTLWAEPVTGILYKEPLCTHFSMSATWLPGINGSGIDPASGKIHLPETTINTVKIIEQSEAIQIKSLYSNSELYGSDSEFPNYKTFTAPPSETRDFWSMLPPFMVNLGSSVLITIIIAVIFPSIFKLCKRLAEKGESKLEETLHFSQSHSRHSRFQRPTW